MHTLPVGDVDWLSLALTRTSAVRLTLTGASRTSHVHSFALYDANGTVRLATTSGIAANGIVLQYSAAPVGAKIRICADKTDSYCESHAFGNLDLGTFQVSFAVVSAAVANSLVNSPVSIAPDSLPAGSNRVKPSNQP